MKAFSVSQENLRKAVEVLKKGGVVIAPTDSVYGLFCDALNKQAVDRVRAIKGRGGLKPFQIAVPKEDAGAYAELDGNAVKLIRECWPGDVNIIVKKKPIVPDHVSARTVCLTCHRNEAADALMRGAKRPLVSTSVNLSGNPPATRVGEIDPQIAGKVDFILDGGETKHGIPNTIVDLTKTPAEVVREGAVKRTVLETLIKLKQ